ncbi:MAG: hypothetical protein IPH31_24095 [Lewinellaceae bacterium]|nr:hypothetical protein [Lewinellaceae bacterium]
MDHIEEMRAQGEYMVPHTGLLGKNGNLILLIISFIVSWLMSLVSPIIVIGIAYCLYLIGASCLGENPLRV